MINSDSGFVNMFQSPFKQKLTSKGLSLDTHKEPDQQRVPSRQSFFSTQIQQDGSQFGKTFDTLGFKGSQQFSAKGTKTDTNYTQNEIKLISHGRSVGSQQQKSDRFESVNENMTRTTSVLDNKNSSLERHRHRLTQDSCKISVRSRLKQFQTNGLSGRDYYFQSCRNLALHQKKKTEDFSENIRILKHLISDGNQLDNLENLINVEQEKLDQMIEKNNFAKNNGNKEQTSPARGRPQVIRRGSVVYSPMKRSGRTTVIMDSNTFSQTVNRLQELTEVQALTDPTKDKKQRSVLKGNLFEKFQYAHESRPLVSYSDFYKSLKHLKSANEYNQFFQQKDNVYLKMIKTSNEVLVMPKANPILKQNINKLENIRILAGKKINYEPIIAGIQSQQCLGLKKVDFSKNKMDFDVFSRFLQVLPNNIQSLNLMNIQLRDSGIDQIIKFIQKTPRIQVINLEQNKVTDKGVITLLESLFSNRTLNSLNLSNNALTSNISETLAKLLKKNPFIRELYLHYNNINQIGGAIIFNGLLKCDGLKVLDLSFNQLGNQNNFLKLNRNTNAPNYQRSNQSDCLLSLTTFLVKQKELVHLDISFNKFSKEETIEIQSALKQNQTLYGFHYEGNVRDYVVDEEGYLQLVEDVKKTQAERAGTNGRRYEKLMLKQTEHLEVDPRLNQKREGELIKKIDAQTNDIQQDHRNRRINGVSKVQQHSLLKSQKTIDTCWLCEGWQQTKFVWTPGRSGKLNQQPLFLHLSFNGYKPIMMTKLSDEFLTYMLCPSSVMVKYFFTNPIYGIQTVAKDQLIMDIEEDDELKQCQTFVYNDDILVDAHAQQQVNYIYTSNEDNILDQNRNYIPLVFARPREDHKNFDFLSFLGDNRNQWRVEASIFNNFKADSEALIDECFEFDFQSSKISKMVKEEEEDVKDILIEYYPYIIHAYKYYASQGSLNNIPCISLLTFYDFLSHTDIMDGGKLRTTDIDVMFISCNGKDTNYVQVYEKAIVRYQFLELLVRIAIDKYLRTNTVSTAADAIIKLFEDDGVLTWLKEFDSAQEWRDIRFWNQECDTLLTRTSPFLKLLFRYTAQINPKTKYYKNMWVSAQDFRDLIFQSSILCDYVSERDCYLAFLLSMSTQVDELFQARHYQMNYYEFLEGLARIAEKLSALPPKKGRDAARSIPQEYEDRRLEYLERKLEGLILNIYFKIGENIKQTFKGQSDSESLECDISVIGLKNVKNRSKVKPQEKLQIQTPQVKQTGKSFQSDSGSDQDSDQSIDIQLKEFMIQNQIKTQPLNAKKVINMSQVLSKVKKLGQVKATSTFSLINIVKFLEKKKDYNFDSDQI